MRAMDIILWLIDFILHGDLNLLLVLSLLWMAAVAGDQVNYHIGRWIGPKVFGWEQSRWFNRRAFDQAHAFYERYGPITIVLARFLPFVRTFAPFVAGVAAMNHARFTLYNVVGATLWVWGVGLAGYVFGNLPWVKANLEWLIWGLIIAIVGAWRRGRATADARVPAGD